MAIVVPTEQSARVASDDTPLALGGQRPGIGTLRVRVPAEATAGNAAEWSIGVADHKIRVTKVTWVPDAAVTGAATNNFALKVVNVKADGSATGTNVDVTSAKTYASGTDSVAHKPEALTLSTTAANLVVDTGEVLTLKRSVNGTGLASPAGAIEVEYVSYSAH